MIKINLICTFLWNLFSHLEIYKKSEFFIFSRWCSNRWPPWSVLWSAPITSSPWVPTSWNGFRFFPRKSAKILNFYAKILNFFPAIFGSSACCPPCSSPSSSFASPRHRSASWKNVINSCCWTETRTMTRSWTWNWVAKILQIFFLGFY